MLVAALVFHRLMFPLNAVALLNMPLLLSLALPLDLYTLRSVKSLVSESSILETPYMQSVPFHISHAGSSRYVVTVQGSDDSTSSIPSDGANSAARTPTACDSSATADTNPNVLTVFTKPRCTSAHDPSLTRPSIPYGSFLRRVNRRPIK